MQQKKRLLIYAGIVFILHLFGNPHYGFFRDELYFIACGLRPAWGYVDQPPVTPLLAAGSQVFGHSLFLLRAVPAIFAAASVYVTGLLVIEFGGGTFALTLSALAAFFCPVLMNFGMKMSTDMPGLFLWPLAALFVVRTLKGGNQQNWIYTGLALGMSFQAKISVLFFAASLFAGLLFTRHRRSLLSMWCFWGAAVFAAISLPYIAWQMHYDFPMMELLRNGQKGKNLTLSPADFMVAQLLITNPFLALIWISGLFWLIKHPTWRFLAIAWAVFMAEMIILHGKHYYSANFYSILIAAGGVAIESWTSSIRRLRPLVSAFVVMAGLISVPFVMPILSEESFVEYNRVVAKSLHLESPKTEKHQDGPLPQDWADMHGWPELTAAVAKVFQSLSPEERAKAVIMARNYGQASAIEFFGKDYALPAVLSGHNQFYLWGTRGNTGEILIDVKGDCGKDTNLYRSSTLAATFTHSWVMPYENEIPIMICRGLNRPLEEIWTATKFYW